VATEEKIVKIVDEAVHTRGASVEVVGSQGALIVKNVGDSGSAAENASLVLAYDVDGNLSTITKTVGAVVSVKTLTYTDGILTNVSTWVEE